MSNYRQLWRSLIWAVPVLAVITMLSIYLRNDREQDSPVSDRHAAGALYRVEARAAGAGWSVENHLQAGDLRYRLGDLQGAAAHWSQAAGSDPARLELLARTYLDLQRWPDALDTLRQLVRVAPENAWAHFQLGAAMLAFDPREAQPHLEAARRNTVFAVDASPLLEVSREAAGDPLVSMRAGTALAAIHRWPQAELAFRHASTVGYPYPEALAYVGLARVRQGKDGDSWMSQALDLGREVPEVHYLHGLALRAEGHDEQSLQAIIQAVRLDPNNPAYYAELGSAYSLLFQYEQSEYWLQFAVAISGDAPQFREMLAVFYAEHGTNLPSANLDTLRELGGNLPPDPEMMAGYGWALYTSGDTEQGIIYIDAALDLNPTLPAARHYRARVLLDQGETIEARLLIEQMAAVDSLYRPWAEDQLAALDALETRAITEPSSQSRDR